MNAPLAAGFVDPVHDAQRAFRAALDALARPGQVVTLGDPIAGLAIRPAMARLLLALTDDDTGVWWQRNDPAATQWLRFHTGADAADRPDQAAFAVVVDSQTMPPLDAFAQGTAAAPEFSTTLLVEVPSLDDGAALQWHGPGIREPRSVRIDGLPATFWAQWQANHAAFPQGVDLIFTCDSRAIGLPRTTRVGRLEGI
jgi:alpha-D-ribose 1-methylphosphonate 5-triphosphate synthase subunit PhnH